MSGFRSNDVDLPPGIPPEHADAYRQAYLRARGEDAAGRDGPGPGEGDGGGGGDEPTRQLDLSAVPPPPTPSASRTAAPASPAPKSRTAAPGRRRAAQRGDAAQRRSALVLAGLAGLAVLLVVGAFVVGRLLADGSVTGGAGGEAAADGGDADTAYDGPVEVMRATGGSASCQAPDSVDEAGNPVSYPPWQAFDGDLATAWRCQGSGDGATLEVTLPEGARVAEVGLVPGYAKTDPASGVDRYAENNRITRVRWSFDDGSSYVQKMSGDPTDRSMRTMRVPESETGSITLEVLASASGTRNTVAVSEIRVAAPAG